MLLKNNLGFSIWIYVFGFSRCNGLIKNTTFILSAFSEWGGNTGEPIKLLNPTDTNWSW